MGNTYQFDAFGMPVASTGTTANTYLYSGERYDSNLNLYHLRARYYNQATGRFETMDPYQGTIFNPGTLHKYVFTGNNPANWVDPTGKDFFEYGGLLQKVTAGSLVGALTLGPVLAEIFCEAAQDITGPPVPTVSAYPPTTTVGVPRPAPGQLGTGGPNCSEFPHDEQQPYMPGPGPTHFQGPLPWPPDPEPVPIGENMVPQDFLRSPDLDAGLINQQATGELHDRDFLTFA